MFPSSPLEHPAAACILFAILAVSMAAFSSQALFSRLMLHPVSIARERKYYLLVTHGFVHANVAHLLFNTVSYTAIAFDVDGFLGPVDFLTVYFGSLVLGALPSAWKNRSNPRYYAVGASGAIAGLLFSGMLFFPEGRIYLAFLPFAIPYPLFCAIFLVVSWYGARRNMGNIAHAIHLAGGIAGMLLTVILRPDVLARFIDILSGIPPVE
ncbi:MAG: rhomboid family intramembrane serine protease [Bacteroidota bacterium]|nr:rhomboid family intramembrane serine protease [Bacteroidota bacterium]